MIFSSIDWSFNWQGQHEVAVRSAGRGGRVLFVENTGVRAPRAADIGRVAHRLRTWASEPLRAAPEVPADIHLYSPLVAPFPFAGWSRRLNRSLFVPKVEKLSRELRDPTIWAFLPTPSVIDAMRAVSQPHCPRVYYCVSDFAEVTTEVPALRRSEQELVADVDIVLTNGEMLRRRFAGSHPRVRTFPFGVDIRRFDPTVVQSEPADIAELPRPLVGYVGGLHRQIAIDWIAAAAEQLPGMSFVFVGPSQAEQHLHRLRLPNVHLLGPRSHAALPAYVASFDVCIIPYRQSTYTESVVPTKMFEYLAMGRPVVSSPLPELAFLDGLSGLMSIADDPRTFIGRIEEASRERPDAGLTAARRAFAQRYSWETMFPEMLREIGQAAAGH